jgi:hypothetical protein
MAELGDYVIDIDRTLTVTGAVDVIALTVRVMKNCANESYIVPDNPADLGINY